MEKIEYTGTVWVINHNNPEMLVEHSIKKLQKYQIKKEDIVLTDAPENVNTEPYESGWLYKMTVTNEGDLDELLTADEYAELIADD